MTEQSGYKLSSSPEAGKLGDVLDTWDFFEDPCQVKNTLNNSRESKSKKSTFIKQTSAYQAQHVRFPKNQGQTGKSSQGSPSTKSQLQIFKAKQLTPQKGKATKSIARQTQQSSAFAKKPTLSKLAALSPSKASALKLVTNQFRLSFETQHLIHIYSLTVFPETKEGKECLREIVKKLDNELKLSFLNYLQSGTFIFSTSFIDEEVEFPCMVGNTHYCLRVLKTGDINL